MTMNRSQRRIMEFGTPEQKAALKAELEDLYPHVVRERNGTIVVPYIHDTAPVELAWMIPYRDIPVKYSNLSDSPSSSRDTHGSTPQHYRRMLTDKFYRGLSELSLVLRPNVIANPSPDINVKRLNAERQLILYVMTILADFGPSHEHKFAYCTYVLDTCCTSVSWKRT